MTSLCIKQSETLFNRAQTLLPGGVSSPVRAFRHVGGTPLFMRSGKGAYLYDEDGNRYIDFCLAWGPLILGHAYPAVQSAVMEAVGHGLAFGTCHRLEADFAELILDAFPYADLVRPVVSGTEAVLTAIRLARAYSKRRLLLKFSGCYHGHVDALLVKAGSGLATQGLPESAGVSEQLAHDTLVLPLGDEQRLLDCFKQYGQDIAAVIIEPLPANNGLLIQTQAFLQQLRTLTTQYGSVLIFDEVISGFRFGFHGYAKLCGVEPDLTTLAKIIGGGLPVGAVLGKRAIMEQLAPLGPVYQAGTMAGNPVALAAGVATLRVLKKEPVYAHLNRLSEYLAQCFDSQSLAMRGFKLARMSSVFWLYRGNGALPHQAETIESVAKERYQKSYAHCLAQGIYLAPSAYEVGFLSYAHQLADIDSLIHALSTAN